MTEHDTALAFDRALDGERGISLNGAESLLTTAETTQTLFDRQQAIPSQDFIVQLEQTLFTPTVTRSGFERPPAAAASLPRPTPRPARALPKPTRFPHRWAAIAAALILILGGVGAIVRGPFEFRSASEPSAIPAVGLGTVEASPEPAGNTWTVEPPVGLDGSDKPGVIANGIVFRTFSGTNQSPMQAMELQTGNVLWVELPGVSTDLLSANGDLLLIAGSNGIEYELIALDAHTGQKYWSAELAQAPKGLLVDDERVFVLGSGDLLEAFDMQTQDSVWQADLSQFGDSTAGIYSGANNFGDLSGDRMTAIDGTIGAIVSSGRLVAIDAADGKVQWADERSTDGWTRVKVVDGKFVVIAFGGETLMYDPEATPLPVTPSDPSADPCTLVIEPRSGSTPEHAPGIGETVDSFDPETGESPWGLILPEQYFVWPVDADRLVTQVEPIQSVGVADNGERFPCVIDGATGAVSETTGDEFVTFVVPSTEMGAYWGLGVLPGGAAFFVDSMDPAAAKSLPLFDLDITRFGGFRWVQQADGMILLTAQDGTLLGFPAGGGTTDATPTMATPAANKPAAIGPGPNRGNAGWPIFGRSSNR